jgi:hypothetical protein
MFKSLHSRVRTVATTGLIAALVVAGVAVAQGGNGNGGKTNHRKAPNGKRMPPPGGPLGKVGKDLTYGQLHVQHNGEAQVIRLDAGEVVSVSDSSITVKENDGNEVTISVDDETKVLAGPGKETAVTDLKEGQHVVVCGPEGAAAKTIAIPPKRGKMPRGRQGSGPGGSQGSRQQGQLPPPPPGGRFGGPQGGSEGGPPQMRG